MIFCVAVRDITRKWNAKTFNVTVNLCGAVRWNVVDVDESTINTHANKIRPNALDRSSHIIEGRCKQKRKT